MKTLFSFALITHFLFLSSVTEKADSLFQIAHDTFQGLPVRIAAYAELVYYYETKDPEKAIELGKAGIMLAGADITIREMGLLYSNMAFVYCSAQEYAKAIPYFKKSAIIFEKYDDLQKAARLESNIGVLYRKLGDYSASIRYQMRSLKKSEAIDDIVGQINALINIGNIHIFQKQPGHAFPFYQKAYALSLLQDDPILSADTKNSLAVGYDQMDQKDSALHYYLQAIADYDSLDHMVKKAKSEHNVAIIYMDREDYAMAEKMLHSSLDVFEQLPATSDVEKATIHSSLGRAYAAQGRHTEAIETFEKALDVFRQRGAKTEEKSTLRNLAVSYAYLEQYEPAYHYHLLFTALKDSIQNEAIATELAELTKKYEAEKKEKEILRLQNQTERAARIIWIGISASFCVIGLLITFIVWFRQKKKLQTAKMSAQLQQKATELDILRKIISTGTTPHVIDHEFTLRREEINSLLKEALSERELDVFVLLLQGHTNREIAEKLFVSINTVKFHLQNIYTKIDVDNRVDAILAFSKEMPVPSQIAFTD